MRNRLQSNSPSQPTLCIWPLPVILAVGAGLVWVTYFSEITFTKPALDFAIVVGLVNLSVYLWLRIWSRLTIAKQSIVAVSLIALQALVVLAVRVDGVDGNGRFIAKWQWKNGRYGHGQLVLLNGFLIVQTERGEIAVVRATPTKFEEVTRFAALSDRTWNHPVVAGQYLLVRNDREAICFKLPLATEHPSSHAARFE